MKDYVLIKFNVVDGNDNVHLVPYDEELFEKLDSHDANYEYEYWGIDMNYLTVGSEFHNIRIIMIRTISANYGPCDRYIEKI